MSIVVYWLDPVEAAVPGAIAHHESFAPDALNAALARIEALRRAGMVHVTLSTDFSAHVGKPGVDAVEGGKTPDGEAYEWSKAGRAGAVRRR